MRNLNYILIVMIALVGTKCFATLGESKVNAAHVTSSSNNSQYSVSSYVVAPNITIREYISKSSGIVFAVSWSGPLKPDLSKLLGRYYPTLTSALAKPHRGRSPIYIKRPNIVIESSGHPQSFFGRAYIPSAMPGILESEIQ